MGQPCESQCQSEDLVSAATTREPSQHAARYSICNCDTSFTPGCQTLGWQWLANGRPFVSPCLVSGSVGTLHNPTELLRSEPSMSSTRPSLLGRSPSGTYEVWCPSDGLTAPSAIGQTFLPTIFTHPNGEVETRCLPVNGIRFGVDGDVGGVYLTVDRHDENGAWSEMYKSENSGRTVYRRQQSGPGPFQGSKGGFIILTRAPTTQETTHESIGAVQGTGEVVEVLR